MKWNRSTIQGVALALVGTLAVFPLSAGLIPGVPDLVWDPIQDGHMVQALAHDVQNIAILSQALQTMQYNIRAFPSRVKGTFEGYAQPFYYPTAGNLFGETASWANTVARGLHTYADDKKAWDDSGVPLKPTSLFANKLLNSNGLNSLAHVEISDAAGINAFQTVNGVRSEEPLNEAAIQKLQESCLNANNDTAAMQANCTAASGILNAQTGQTTNALLAAGVDVNTTQLKTERDREARRLNFESRVLEYQATEPTSVDLSTDSLRNFQFNFGGGQ
jgi:hypothetical protein